MKKLMVLVMVGTISMMGVMAFADQPVKAVPVLISAPIEKNVSTEIFYNELAIETSLEIERINAVSMLPLNDVATAMGYTVTWNSENRTVEIRQGAQWTSITIGENKYFKNSMDPLSLSAEPPIIYGRTYVPVEFFVEILDRGLDIKEGKVHFSGEQMAIHTGYVQEVQLRDKGQISIVISSEEKSKDIMDQTVIHTSADHTLFNTPVVVGDRIKVISPPIMTMSIPGQTSGHVVYQSDL